MLVAVEGIIPSPSDDASDALLQAAEAAAREVLGGGAVEQIPHVAQWRQAYRAFRAKPQRTRNSLEALLRRGPPRPPRGERPPRTSKPAAGRAPPSRRGGGARPVARGAPPGCRPGA